MTPHGRWPRVQVPTEGFRVLGCNDSSCFSSRRRTCRSSEGVAEQLVRQAEHEHPAVSGGEAAPRIVDQLNTQAGLGFRASSHLIYGDVEVVEFAFGQYSICWPAEELKTDS